MLKEIDDIRNILQEINKKITLSQYPKADNSHLLDKEYIKKLTVKANNLLRFIEKRSCESCKYMNFNNGLCSKLQQCISNFTNIKTFCCSEWEG